MVLFINCKHCSKEIKVKGSFANRWELSAKRGRMFEMKCSNCKQEDNYSVDNVKAKAGIISTIALILLFPSIAVIFWLLYPFSTKGIIPMFLLPVGMLIPTLIYVSVLREQKRKLESFNSTRPNSLRAIKFTKKF